MGQRVRNVMSELSGEKIDIIDYDEDPARFVANALSPAKVVSVTRHRRGARGPPGWWCRTSSCRWRSARKGRTPGWRPGSPAGASISAATLPRRAREPGAPGGHDRPDDGPGRPRSVCSEQVDGRLSRDPARDFGYPTLVRIRRPRSDRCGRVWGAGSENWPSNCVRVVAVSDRHGNCAVTVDSASSLPGRGAWLHPDQQCLDAALRRRAFVRALRITGSPDTSAVVEYFSTAAGAEGSGPTG